MYESITEYPLEFQIDMKRLLEIEGGVADRPQKDDPGGYTVHGITIGSFNRYLKQRGEGRVNKSAMRMAVHNNLPLVYDFYYSLYWKKVGGASLPAAFRYVLFDINVLEGVRGIKRVQALLGLRQDGVVGPRTLGMLESRSDEGLITVEETLDKIGRVRLSYLQSRAHWEANANGWTRRVQEALLFGKEDHSTRYAGPLTSFKPESPTVSGLSETENTMESTKSAFASKTVWAGIAQLVIAVLGFFGVDIAPGDVEVGLGLIESVIVAITGLLTIFGRVTAEDRIG